MNKPEKETISAYDYNELIDFIEKKHNIDTRDYARGFSSSVDIIKKYNEMMGRTIITNSTQFSTDEYRAFKQWREEQGWKEKPYLDFWHWFLEQHGTLIAQVQTLGKIPSLKLLDFHEHRIPDWVREILTLIEADFLEEGEDDILVWLEV